MADVERDVLARLGQLTLAQLEVVHADLRLPDIDPNRRAQPHVLKVILRYLNSEDVEDSDDGGLAHFLMIQTYLDTIGIVKVEPATTTGVATTTPAAATAGVPTTTPAAVTITPPATSTATSTAIAAQTSAIPTTRNITPAVSAAALTSVPSTTMAGATPIPATTDYATLKKVLRKDWKLKGSIGLPGEKDKLAFSGLAYQINQATKKGYEDSDICEEVIKCVTDDVLRSLLEGKANLTLASLRKLLRAHFKEKDPTTLFTTLSRSVQKSNDTASYFVMKMMDLRAKILFATKEVDSRVNYTEDIVREQFTRTVTTGIRNDNIRNEVKHLFSQALEDEDFLDKLNQAESDEIERMAKMGEANPAVALVSTGSDNGALEALSKKVDALTGVCEQNNAEIVALKAELGDNKSNAAAKKRTRCIPCEENNLRNCRHCFACGSGKHIRPKCDQLN